MATFKDRLQFAAVLLLAVLNLAKSQDCTNGDLRLANGVEHNEGRLELCNANAWGTICQDYFSSQDATVACKQLDFPGAIAVRQWAYFGPGTGDILLDDVTCIGNEERLLDCEHEGIGVHDQNCDHRKDVGVVCQVGIRLVNGPDEYEGRVEVYYQGEWGTVCQDLFSIDAASVGCKELGYGPATQGSIRYNAFYGQGTGPILLDNVNCLGTEDRLFECLHLGIGTDNCNHGRDVGFRCELGVPCTNGDLRLVGGAVEGEGRVEVCWNGNWHTICEDFWGTVDARVVCRQLGFADAIAGPRGATFGRGINGIILDNVRCAGTETSILNCPRDSPLFVNNCAHAEDAGVQCLLCNDGDLQLIGGDDEFQGRVEICLNGAWGTICHGAWNHLDAIVVCRQLGYGTALASTKNSFFGPSNKPIFYSNFLCSSREARLDACRKTGPDGLPSWCINSAEVGVICSSVCEEGAVRLAGFTASELQGNVEVCHDNQWGGVCDDNWGSNDARVVCRQLGFSGGAAHYISSFGVGNTLIWLDELRCTGSEQRLVDCPARPFGDITTCSQYENAGVTCTGPATLPPLCNQGDIRLVDGPDSHQGRIEVCNDEAWGTVCQDDFYALDATVACVQLGFQGVGARQRRNRFYGPGSGQIVLDNLGCAGTETSLFDCPNPGIGVHNCNHNRDVGVDCPRICTNGELRLAGTNNPTRGRLEICVDERWGTICDDGWDNTDASVACFQLGYGRDAVAFTNAFFGQGTGPIVLDEVGCEGTETHLIECSHIGLNNHNCWHGEDVGVSCSGTCTDGDIRLAGGSTKYEGRVELCRGGVWGTVCDDFFNTPDAMVVCRQLGFQAEGAYDQDAAFFGQGTGDIFQDDTHCVGTEARLVDCPSNTLHNCGHNEDVSVICPNPNTFTDCDDWDIRLVDGANDMEGRVEVCQAGVWGTVCDDSWGPLDAMVICATLGFSRQGLTARYQAYFGQGSGPIVLDDLRCRGDEAAIQFCPRNTFGHNCGHTEDAGVQCVVCIQGEVRLSDGPSANEGRVEVCNNGNWGTICQDLWGPPDGGVVCSQLGFSRIDAATNIAARSGYGAGTGQIVFDNLECVGTEDSVFDCPGAVIGNHNCDHSLDAGVVCMTDLACNNGEVRFVDGPTPSSGRVEVCVHEVWGTVCDSLWDPMDAVIVCLQLGFSRHNATTSGGATYGQGTGPIQLTELRCTGSEDNLLSCPGADTSTVTCSHQNDAGIECIADLFCEDGAVRLAGDPELRESEMVGRVEICLDETWGTVCSTWWSFEDATVTCRQLGYYDQGAASVRNAAYGPGTGPIYVSRAQCTGSELRLIDCRAADRIGINNCNHNQDASVRCQSIPPPCSHGDVRLMGGSRQGEGRVEFCNNQAWGTVCDDFWGLNDVNVVCGQLGFIRDGDNAAFGSAAFGQGTGPIWLDNVACVGTEERLELCPHLGIGTHNCQHREDAGVRCQECVSGTIRLADGPTPVEGRVEVCSPDNVWGLVCHDQWGALDATVVCRQLGLLPFGTSGIAVSFGQYGIGTGEYILDNVQCAGTETSLFDCPHNGIGVINNCPVGRDVASVMCPGSICFDEDIRLMDGPSIAEGRLEMCFGFQWFSVCDTNFEDDRIAAVACKQLGFSRYHAEAVRSVMYGTSPPTIMVDNLVCNGTEQTVSECSYTRTPSTRCSINSLAGLICRDELLCETNDLRLVGGSSNFEGRVELCIDETWTSICADGAWTNVDANVACRQAGYSATGATAFIDAFFGQGDGPIQLDVFACIGTESRLSECSFDSNQAGCLGRHAQDAGVRCNEGCTNGEIRLAGGSSPSLGRVEICVQDSWGTVCDDFWGTPDATVVCRQLGFQDTGARALSFAAFGQGSGAIHLDDVQCIGTESSLLDCSHTTNHNCIHAEDAGAICQGCLTGSIRLANGFRPSEGRVEICENNVWGTICDEGWGVEDATVVCRELGFSVSGAVARTGNYFTPAADTVVPIYFFNVMCASTENRLADCPATDHSTTCLHSQDVGVECQEFPVCNEGALRLVGGNDLLEGRLEICRNEVWGTICDDGWNNNGANVACRQLGYSRLNAVASSNAAFGEGTGPIHLDNVQCSGSEYRLTDCTLSTDASECTHAEDAGLRCSGQIMCQNGQLRLADGNNDFEGRVELCYNETWGTICDGFWTEFESNVVCRQLGYQPFDAVPFYDAHFGPGTGPIWLDDVFCFGDEQQILDCFHPGLTNIDFCNGHNDDVGVRCFEGCVNGQIRLSNGRSTSEGRVEICLNQQWGTVCDDGWADVEASVVCQQLGFSRFNAFANTSAAFGQGTGLIHLDNVACTGSETALNDCVYDSNTIDCSHTQDAGVSCAVSLICNDGDLRLGGTASVAGEGRVEICIGETWGTICDNSWDNNDATVACRAAGFSSLGAVGLRSSFYGPGTGMISLDNVGCVGSEDSLLDCNPSLIPATTCSHSNDASIRCNPTPVCQIGDVQLIVPAGSLNNSGRVEVCVNEQWGSVCDTNWDQNDANVVCKQLGFSRFNAVARRGGSYGQSSGAIAFSNLGCSGTEAKLTDCPSQNSPACTHANDAGVDCSTALVCREGYTRLADGEVSYEGRVEVCISETWNTICDNGWSLNDANVVCKQLGHLDSGAEIFNNAYFGQGTGPIAFTNVACSGNENSLLGCDLSSDLGTCTHADDASVRCQEVCINGDTRLRDGLNQYEGRVEVCLNEQWGTVCDDLWDSIDAGVACRQLGFSEHNATALSFAPFGQGIGPIWIDNIACDGSENRLTDCGFDTHTADCAHFEDAGVRCLPCSTGDIRLVGGTSPYNGRVEVCKDQTWGTICDDGWSALDARVVCRHLEFSGIDAQALSGAAYGQGFGPIYLDNVACGGNEVDIFDCQGDAIHDCDHSQDASVICNYPPVCVENQLQLVGGAKESQGRVEICRTEVWNTVCDIGWTDEEGAVACRQLGYSRYNANITTGASFGQGNGPIYGSNIICNGEEDNLADCVYSMDISSCLHSNDAGVYCSETVICMDGDIRLADGPNMFSGRVEICDDETWGSVCDDSWRELDANVACRQLGFAPIGSTPQYAAFYGQGDGPIFLYGLFCYGQESRLVDCPHFGVGAEQTSFCTGGHASDAGVICGAVCTNGDIRLANGNNPYEGRVEVCNEEAWGTVCDDHWTIEDANVACRQAGFSRFGAQAFGEAFFDAGLGLIHLDDLMCDGTESSLFQCMYDPTHNCFHDEDAGVRCIPEFVCNDGDLRLCDINGNCGTDMLSGRLEYCMDETWGTVCNNQWSVSDAKVACTQLGHSISGAVAVSNSTYGFGEPDQPIHLGGLNCDGSESSLMLCASTGRTGCNHALDAGLECQPKLCSDGEIRLVGGMRWDSMNKSLEGRLEYCSAEQWGTVCDNNFDNFDARVVCRQAGFSLNGAVAYTGNTNPYGQAAVDVPVYLDQLNCIGSETNLQECSFAGVGTVIGCGHDKDSAVSCQIRQSFPSAVDVTSLDDISLVVSWSAPLEFYSDLNRYNVRCGSISQTTLDATTTSLTITSLAAATTYSCCVTALYSDSVENAQACGSATTMEGIPGPPSNLDYNPLDATACSSATLTWDLPSPSERNGIISMYRVEIFLGDEGDAVVSALTTTPTYQATGLDCCTLYTFRVFAATTAGFGPAASGPALRMLADLSVPIDVAVAVTSDTSIQVGWTIPDIVMFQHTPGDVYSVALIPDCKNGQNSGIQNPPQAVFPYDGETSTEFSGLQTEVPYRVRATTVVCQSSVTLYDQIWFTRSTSTLQPPEITVISRYPNDPSTAAVVWESASADVVDINVYSGQDTNADNLIGTDVIPLGASTSKQYDVRGLDICTEYWFVARAATCAAEEFSSPFKAELRDVTPFTFSFSLSDAIVTQCENWVKTEKQDNIASIESAMIDTLNTPMCGIIQVGCFSSSTFTCDSDKLQTVYFSTSLVGHGLDSSSFDQSECLNEWLNSNPTISLAAGNIMANTATTDAPEATPAPVAGLPTFGIVLVILAVAVVAIVVLVLTVVILMVRRRPSGAKKPSAESASVPHQLMDEQDDVSIAGHSVGIVENPLYADQEDFDSTPTYAALRAKEKEAEELEKSAALHSAGQGFAINYDPPDDF